MRVKIFCQTVAVAAMTLAAAPLGAQPLRPEYVPAAEIVTAGTVKEVLTRTGESGTLDLVLIVKTPEADVTVYVGPVACVARNNFSFLFGQPIEIIGARVVFENEPCVVARAIFK